MRTVIETIKRGLRSRGFAYNVGVLAGGTAMAQAVNVLSTPVLTRLFTPDDFGVLGVYLSIFSILLAVNSLRYEFAINLPKDDREAANLLGLTLLLVIITTVLFEIALALLADLIIAWTNAPALRPYLWLIPLGLLGAGFYEALSYWTIRKKHFGSIARTRFMQSASSSIAPIGVWLVTTGPLGLLVGHLVSQGVGSGSLARQAWREERETLRHISWRGMAQVARKYYRFPLLSSWSSLLNTLGLNLPRLLISAFYGLEVIGWFSFGQRIIAIPMTLVGTSVGQVFLSTAAQLKNEAPDRLKPFYLKTARRLFLLGLAPSLVLTLTGAPLFAWAFGEEWRAAGLYAQILAPMFLIQFVVSSLSQILIVLQRQNIQLVWDVARLVALTLALIGASELGWEGVGAVALYSLTMGAAYLILFGLQWRALVLSEGVVYGG